MQDANVPDSELLKNILSPLLEDFQYWFARSQDFLASQRLSFMSDEEQAALLARVEQAQAEVSTAKMLFAVADGKVGIDMETVMPWHRLVHECWGVAMRHRSQSQA